MARNHWIYRSVMIFPVLWVFGAYLGGWYHYLTLILGYLVIPLADLMSGPRPWNVSPDEAISLRRQKSYDTVLFLYAPVVTGLMIWAAYFASTVPMALTEWIGFTLSSGLISGAIGMTIAHELCHRKDFLSGLCARVILIHVCYMHFVIEHVYGHHVKIATPEDPATARKGESLYQFIIRSVFGGLKSAWSIECHRLKKLNLSPYSVKNQMIWFAMVPFLFFSGLSMAFGPVAGLFFIIQAMVGFSYLEVINYVEHYGLLRKKNAKGRYEKISPQHSWNSDHRVSVYLLFGLPNHSDHHANADRPYQILRSVPDAPQLPFSYPVMVTLAFFPGIWRKLMDHRVDSANHL